MRGTQKALIFLALAAILAAALPAAAMEVEPPVSSIKINLTIAGPQPPAPIKEKISYSVQQVGIKALTGKPLSEAREVSPELNALMEKIFNQVLSGYKVTSLDINVARETLISINIEPVGAFIDSLNVSLSFEGGINPLWNGILAPEVEPLSQEIKKIFATIPAASAPWASKILISVITETLPFNKYFPGFEVHPILELGDETSLKLALKATGETVRLANIKVRSTTIPSLLIERLKYDAASRSDIIIGLPVLFAEKKKDVISSEISKFLSETSLAQKLFLDVTSRIIIGRTTRIAIVAESRRYSGSIKGKVSLGKEEKNPDIETHLGFFPLGGIELFTESNFYPGPIDLQADLGVGYRLHNSLYAAVGKDVIDGISRIWLNTYLTEDVIISWEKGVNEDPEKDIEGSITFRAHEFFSFTLTTDFSTDIWLSFNANL